MTTRRPNESEVPSPRSSSSEAVTLPPDAKVPAEFTAPRDTDRGGSELDHLAARLGELSDALHSPEGLVSRLFAASEQSAAKRHEELMGTLRHLADGQSELSARLAKLEPEVERHGAALTLLPPHSAGNGADHS